MKTFLDSLLNSNSTVLDNEVKEEIKIQLQRDSDDLHTEIVYYFGKKIADNSFAKKTLLERTLMNYKIKYEQDKEERDKLIDKLSSSLTDIILYSRHYKGPRKV